MLNKGQNPEGVITKIHFDEYPDYVNKGLCKAAEMVAKEGSKRGHEYPAIVDLETGEVVDFGTSKASNSVSYYHSFLKANPKGKYIMVHNHNTESPLSLPDIQELVSWDNLDAVCAVTNNGLTYSVRHNGVECKDYLWLKYEKEVKRLREHALDSREIELRLVDVAVKELGKGGIRIHDGRL